MLYKVLALLCVQGTQAATKTATSNSHETAAPSSNVVGDPNAVGGWTYDYSQNGTDWPKLVSSNGAINYCG